MAAEEVAEVVDLLLEVEEGRLQVEMEEVKEESQVVVEVVEVMGKLLVVAEEAVELGEGKVFWWVVELEEERTTFQLWLELFEQLAYPNPCKLVRSA